MFILFQNLFDIQFKYCIFVFQNEADDENKIEIKMNSTLIK